MKRLVLILVGIFGILGCVHEAQAQSHAEILKADVDYICDASTSINFRGHTDSRCVTKANNFRMQNAVPVEENQFNSYRLAMALAAADTELPETNNAVSFFFRNLGPEMYKTRVMYNSYVRFQKIVGYPCGRPVRSGIGSSTSYQCYQTAIEEAKLQLSE